MKLLKRPPLLSLSNNFYVDLTPTSNFSYGSWLGLYLVIHIIIGVTLAMHFSLHPLDDFYITVQLIVFPGLSLHAGLLIRTFEYLLISFFKFHPTFCLTTLIG